MLYTQVVKDKKTVKKLKFDSQSWVLTKKVDVFTRLKFAEANAKVASITVKFWGPVQPNNVKDFEKQGVIFSEQLDCFMKSIISEFDKTQKDLKQ